MQSKIQSETQSLLGKRKQPDSDIQELQDQILDKDCVDQGKPFIQETQQDLDQNQTNQQSEEEVKKQEDNMGQSIKKQAQLPVSVYYFKNNLRFVKPYTHEFVAYSKQRWLNCGLLEIYCKEFLANTHEYYKQAIEDGRITVNGKVVSCDYKLQRNERIVHSVQRTEPPVIDKNIDIVYEDYQLIAVDKPPSMSVHEGGQYKYNTLAGILEYEMNKKGLKPVHRLDRQTSGIVFFAKNSKASNEFRQALDTDQVQKIYLARVMGNFKEQQGSDEIRVNKAVYAVNIKEAIYDCGNIEDLSEEQKITAKSAETLFKFLFYDEKSNTSVIQCFPKTGRTHQIRVHLKSVGHAIANDRAYGGIYLNNGNKNEFQESDFEGIYQNENYEGKEKLFLILWLHASEYTYKDIKAKTSIPEWAKEDFVIQDQLDNEDQRSIQEKII